ncbi:TolC family protein [Desulfosarcina alkanivorans]|nr:TolC family protein [Desulfosarcina alkanivorans]
MDIHSTVSIQEKSFRGWYTRIWIRTLFFNISFLLFFCGPTFGSETLSGQIIGNAIRNLSLEDCLEIALTKNRQRQISESAIKIAEAQHQQVLSTYWPQLSLKMNANRLDESPNLIFPESTMALTVQGPGPTPIQSNVTVHEIDVKLMDRDSLISSVGLVYPIYMGGKRTAMSKQASTGVNIAKEAARKTDLQIVLNTKKLYYGAVLATSLHKLGRETLDRLNVLLELTEMLYKTGTGTVMKTDFLRTQVIVTTIRSSVALLASNEELAKAALSNAIGLSWREHVVPAANEIPFVPFNVELDELISNAYQFNPEWSKLKLALEAAEAGIKEARSGYFPTIALNGNLSRIDNSYDAGIMSDKNIKSWNIGISMQLPLFRGFRTKNEIREATARFEKKKQEKLYFKEGLGLLVKDTFLQLARAQEQVMATGESLASARENRKLNVRAYQNELAETKEVIEAQLLEPFISAQYLKARHDHAVSRSRLDFIIGNEILEPLRQGAAK